MNNHYSWVETHNEITKYLSENEDNQLDLIELLKSVGITPFNDRLEDGVDTIEGKLEEIDPFTFYCYIYKYGEERRLKFLQEIARKIGAKVPYDEKGIPSAQAQKVWLFPYKYLRKNNEITRLWSFFKKAIDNKITNEDFLDILKLKGVGKTKLTEILFYIQPEKYFPINGPTKPFLRKSLGLSIDFNNYQEYLDLLDNIKSNTDIPFYELSFKAWEWNSSHITSKLGKKSDDLSEIKNEFIDFINRTNIKGSQKASSYIRALDLLDNILRSKANNKLEGGESIYSIVSVAIIEKLYSFILEEQKNKSGIFEKEEPTSYWQKGFYSAALKSYMEFLNFKNLNIGYKKKEAIPFLMSKFEESCSDAGLNYDAKLITRYISSIATKPFVLLSGLSGSGKTKLAQAFAQWIAEDKNQYCIVPVGADWTNREPLLGYVNALNNEEYILPENGALTLLIEANKEENKTKPYFLILDEMNLSHVERYFADFLSIMESKDQLKLHSDVENKGIVSSHLDWPKNLFIVGTVNIDETTYMFSSKVLDRANVIEFRVNKDDISKFLDAPTEIYFTNLNGKGAGMSENFIEIASNKEFPKVKTDKLNEKLVLFFEELKKTGAEFGYRTAIEIHRLYNQLTTLDNTMLEEAKIDIAIMQKLLPKLHGSRRKLCPILETLASFCVVEKTDVLKAFLNNREAIDFKTNTSVLYPLSLEKITRMYKGAVDNGFASYAEA
ncbi:McrB family protein [Polaribacter sp. 20A6]|uniref:McrB family protein n=1 Tax=Polaribacter sp. 20A6 TaxID=2687289 RepID=UPI0013FE4C5C|nr:hypothetical protein [Polaribacter sp. 20A6]